MWSITVVLDSKMVGKNLNLGQRMEHLAIEELVPETAVELA